jgi:protein-tyrosine-phosphatase
LAAITVVFVCTGNTCRSPLAMALARRRWPAATVLSAGLQALDCQPAAEAAQVVARERGADLGSHRARRLDGELVARADWIIGMTRSHVAQLNAALRGSSVRVGLLGTPNVDLAGRPTPADEEVADPFGASLETYRTTADQLERLLAAWDETMTAGAGTRGGGSA